MSKRILFDDDPDPNEGRRAIGRTWIGYRSHVLKPNEELIRDFCDLVREGVAPSTVADKLGVGPATFRRWLRCGVDFEESGGEPAEHVVYAAFLQEFRKARACFLIRMTREALRADARPRFVRRALEVLRRRDAKNWTAPVAPPEPSRFEDEHEAAFGDEAYL